MRFLVVGLGSMGKRRIRNLQALGHRDIAGFDPREDRRSEAATKYGITIHSSFNEALDGFCPDALVISTPPDRHMDYVEQAADRGLPCFIEASVIDADRILAAAERVRGTPILMAPSCTMRFFPGPKRVRALLESGVIGRPLSLHYHTGQYLPDWHPWEDIGDFYVSNRSTGGCREIVPFELTWLNALFGDPEPLACHAGKLSDISADIDDVYVCLLRYPGGLLANLTVDVISRPHATRELRILGSEGQIVYSADEQCVRHLRIGDTDWQRFDLASGSVEAGYINPEEPYIEELRVFIAALEQGDKSIYPNTLEDDYRVLATLQRLESLAGFKLP